MTSRINEAKALARSLLDDLELSTSPAAQVLMKAKRLARLMRDTNAQKWLELEASGYPERFDFSTLETCSKYARKSRIGDDGKYFRSSIPETEAFLESAEAILDSMRSTQNPAPVAKNPGETHAALSLMKAHANNQLRQRQSHAHYKRLYTKSLTAIHSYATDLYIAIELGDAVEDIFNATRASIDAFVATYCPSGAEKLVAINERMNDGTQEGFATALTSCRRLLLDIADGIFPAQETPYIGSNGKERNVGRDQYKNRILAFLDRSEVSRGSAGIVESGLTHLAARLDAINDKTCKGVHAEVTLQEARLAVINTYLYIGEVANAGFPENSD
jgi:hypothetical protein